MSLFPQILHSLLTKISKLGGKLSTASSVPEVQLSQYVPALENLATLRLLHQVSNVYQIMKIETLSGIIPFFDFSVVEKISVDAVKQKFVSMKVDHMRSIVIFCKMEREEESKRLRLQKITEEAEQRRLATEYEQRKNQRILREIEDREMEEAQALLQEAEKCIKKKGKRTIIEGEKLTKQTLMELTLTEQLRERQEMEKKLQKLAKTMDYLERAKREEAAPPIEAAHQQRLVEERILHEREQQQEIELSKQRHEGDLKENKELYQERVVIHRQAEFNRLRREKEERISKILQSRRQEREKMRKLKLKLEERQQKLREEEEAWKREEAERQRKAEAERLAKLAEIAEKQRQREQELEEKERQRREALLGRSAEAAFKPSELPACPMESGPATPAAVSTATAAAPTPGKYVPRFRREKTEGTGPVPPPETNRWTNGSSRQDGGRCRSDDLRPAAFGSGGGLRSSSTWSSSRNLLRDR